MAQNWTKAFTVYRIALAPARRPYRVGRLFTNKTRVFAWILCRSNAVPLWCTFILRQRMTRKPIDKWRFTAQKAMRRPTMATDRIIRIVVHRTGCDTSYRKSEQHEFCWYGWTMDGLLPFNFTCNFTYENTISYVNCFNSIVKWRFHVWN